MAAPTGTEVNRLMTERHVPSDQLRATDEERRTMVDRLGRGLAVGCLTAAEFEQRASAAWAARTRGDLSDLAADLPTPLPGPATSPAQRRAEQIARMAQGLSTCWLVVGAFSVGLWGLLLLSGAATVGALWWVTLVVGGGLVMLPLRRRA